MSDKSGISEILSSFSGLSPLSGLFGGQPEVNVSQSSSNTTGVQVSSVLSNMSPGAGGSNAEGSASSDATSRSTGGSQSSGGNPLPSLFDGSVGSGPPSYSREAISNISKNNGQATPSTGVLLALGAGLGLVGFMFSGKGKKGK